MNGKLERDTASGRVRGRADETSGVISWLGVPYAAAPVGGLRWRAPQPHPGWSGVRDCCGFSQPSLQVSDGAVIGSEDCLTLNIYSPDGAEKLPVFFFIHGGNNQTDSGEMLDGEVMARALDAVVVSINLRLGVLGWLHLAALRVYGGAEDSGNYGLLDILCALDWVRENIENFGGDAGNITASGYSSGARDLLAMLITPAFEGKFSRAVTFSGGFTVSDPGFSERRAAEAIAPLAVEDGAAKDPESAAAWLLSGGGDVRRWLCSVEGARFAPLMAGAAIRMRVFPHLFADGRLIPAKGFGVLEHGRPIDVPMLCFSGGHEFDFAGNNDPLFKNADFSDGEVVREYRFATKYGGALFGYINAEQNAAAFTSAPGAKSPVYAGRCFWGMDGSVTDEYAAMRMGGTHGLDLYLMMGAERGDYAVSPNVYTADNRPGRDALAAAYRGYLRSFVHTGDPNGGGLPRWEPWDAAGRLMCFDASRTEARCAMTRDVVREDEVFAEIERDSTLSPERKSHLLHHVLDGRFFSGGLDPFVEEKGL